MTPHLQVGVIWRKMFGGIPDANFGLNLCRRPRGAAPYEDVTRRHG